MSHPLPQRLNRRQALALLVSGAGAVLLAACGSAAAPAASPASSAGAPPASAQPAPASSSAAASGSGKPAGSPKPGGTLQIGTVTDITQLEGHRLQGQNFTMLFTVFDRLTEYDDQLQPQPGLAESWDFTSDAKQLTLHLRKGVQFHTGRTLTSDDIKFNILRSRDPKTGAAQLVTMGNWWTDIQTPDANTVILKSDQPRPTAFDFLEYLNIIDPVTLKGPDAQKTLVGTGPFKFGEWVTGDHLTLQKNPNYWQSGKPYLDTVTFRIGHDPQAVLTQLEAKALDAMDSPPVEGVAPLQSAGFQIVKNAHTGGYTSVLVNTAYPPLDKKEVRQALSFALNRQRYFDTVLKGNGSAQDLPWPSNSPAYEPAKNTRYAFDLGKAKSLLASAGVSNPKFDLVYANNTPSFANFAQIYQADLGSIGMQATLQPLAVQEWAQVMPKGQYNGLSFGPGGFAQLQPTSFFLFSIYWQLKNNAENFDSDQYRQLLTDVSGEPDAAKRKALYSQINDFLLDQCFVIIAGTNPETFAASPKVQALAYNIRAGIELENAWLA